MTDSTLVARFHSIKLSIDMLVRCGLSTLAMNNPAEIEKQLAHIEAVIELYRGERSKLAGALASLEEMANKLRKATGRDPMPSTMEESDSTAPDQPLLIPHSPLPVEKPSYRYCEKCETLFKLESEHPHDCGPGPVWGGWNTFEPPQLDIIHGEGGWNRIDPPVQETVEHAAPEHEIEAALSNPPLDVDQPQVIQFTPRTHGLREGSKKYRIYELTATLLQAHGSMYIDEIMKNMPTELFDEVKSPDKRTNLSNVLSQLKTKGLLISDNRGNWSLPTRRAAD